jgi:hypothetical protein
LGLEQIARAEGSPRAVVLAADGELYFLLDQPSSNSLWRLPFDETGDPKEPAPVGSIPGQALSLAVDPLSASLFALVRERLGDTVVLELGSGWLADPTEEPLRVFSLDDFVEETMEGRSQDRETERKRAASMIASVRLPTTVLPEDLDFLAFDNLGLLYLGARDKDLVLKFDLDRLGSSRHMVNIAAAIQGVSAKATGSPKARLQAWRKNRIGS